jgi:toxin ParE1/3/4
MVPVIIRPAARNDQLELAEYYDTEGGEALGDRFLRNCTTGVERLSTHPESGTLVRHKHPRLRGARFILVPEFEKIVIFYKALPDHIEIIRILHGARDVASVLP